MFDTTSYWLIEILGLLQPSRFWADANRRVYRHSRLLTHKHSYSSRAVESSDVRCH